MNAYRFFETERLLLQPTGLADASFLLRLLNSPGWLRYIGDRQVYSVADAEAYIQSRMLPQFERLGFANYTVIRKADGAKMGCCGLYDREGLQNIDIGFAFLPEYAGQGYAYEAALRLKQAGLETFGLRQICAITTKENTSSQKLLEKLGLSFSKPISLPQDKEELLLYQLINEPNCI